MHVVQAKNEVKVLNSLNHPNIVKYYECYQERNMMHIIMEFCQVIPPSLLSSCSCMMWRCVCRHCVHCHCLNGHQMSRHVARQEGPPKIHGVA